MDQKQSELPSIIKTIYKQYDHAVLANAYKSIQKKYSLLKKLTLTTLSERKSFLLIANEVERIAYLLMRMPATYAVASKVLNELFHMNFSSKINSLLDLGSGTGAMLWAAMNAELREVTAIDHDIHTLELAKKIAMYSAHPLWQSVNWQSADMTQEFAVKKHDLVTIAYALIEQNENDRHAILTKAWSLTKQALVIIEPGTKNGFRNCLGARDFFIRNDAYIAAPCSHMNSCPIKRGDWCHFSERIERSFWQQHFKEATLGYEDEAYSYLIVTKKPIIRGGERILKPPMKRSGHLILDLCAPNTVKKITVTRRQKEIYKKAKKLRWGDVWN